MRGRLATLLVIALSVLVPFAGAARAAAVQDAPDRVLRVNWGGFPESLDPQQSDRGQWGISGGIDYEGLTHIDAELQVVPGAAESWEFNDDGTAITFHLRDGLVFSDGVPVTAEHFRYAAERLCSPELNARSSIQLADVVGCEELFSAKDDAAALAARAKLGVQVVDDQTLEYRFDRPAAYFPFTAANWGAIPLRQDLIEAGGPDWWSNPATRIGNGPYKLVAYEDQEPDQILTYARNDRYWGGATKLDALDFLFIDSDDEQNLAMYQAGELDMTWPAEESFPAIEADPVLSRELTPVPVPGTIFWGFNLTRELFQDPKVREAFAYAFDREAYSQQICFDACEPTLSWIPPNTPGSIDTDAFAFDPAKAREALAASSYGGPENLPEVVWYVAEESPIEVRFGEWIYEQYRQALGVELKLVSLPDDEYDALFDSDATWPQFNESTWFSGPDPRSWFMVWRCGSPMNRGYCNAELEELLDRADAELDPEERLALYEEAGHLLVADAPAIFVHNASWRVLIKPYVSGYSPDTPNEFWPGYESLMTIDVNRPE